MSGERAAAARLRRLPARVAVETAGWCSRRGESKGPWLHFDVDVLDDELMPAVDSREPGGLTHDQVAAIMSELAASGLLCGVTVTIFDPDQDPSGRLARELVATLARGLGRGSRCGA